MMSKYGFAAVKQLEVKGYDYDTLYTIYNSALVQGRKREEITEVYLIDEYSKSIISGRYNAVDQSKNEKKETTTLTPSKFAKAQCENTLCHPVYGHLSYVGACAFDSTEVMAITDDGKVVEVDIKDLYVPHYSINTLKSR